MHIVRPCVHRQSAFKAGTCFIDGATTYHQAKRSQSAFKAGTCFIAGFAVVAASSLMMGERLARLSLGLGPTFAHSTDINASVINASVINASVINASVSAQADRAKSRSQVLVAAFVPAPKHPPKVTQGTGSR
jgi:hypothetical protein